jgi:hypothetical protein
MTRSTTGATLKSRRGALALLSVVLLASVGMLVATALASNASPRKSRRTDISILTRKPRQTARKAAADSVVPPPEAILANVVDGTEVYAFRNASGEDCVLRVSNGGGSVCDSAAVVEAQGEIGISGHGEGATAPGSPATLQVTALVPNGIKQIKITDRDGASYTVPVVNNVAEREDINIASVSYRLPRGTIYTTDVAAIVDRIPRQPGPPGSSN